MNLISLGAAFAASNRNDGGGVTSRIHHYEVFAQSYLKLPANNLFLRSGVRLGYEHIPDEEAPQSIKIREQSFRGGFELGILYEGLMVPSISLQAGVLRRKLTLDTSSQITSKSTDFPMIEWLPMGILNLGLGLPIEGGKLILEPFYRFVWIAKDTRQTSQWGIDASWSLSFEN
jgi:hypothetical protein